MDEGSWTSASKLLREGVDPIGVQDMAGRSLMEIAINRDDQQMISLLKSYNADKT